MAAGCLPCPALLCSRKPGGNIAANGSERARYRSALSAFCSPTGTPVKGPQLLPRSGASRAPEQAAGHAHPVSPRAGFSARHQAKAPALGVQPAQESRPSVAAGCLPCPALLSSRKPGGNIAANGSERARYRSALSTFCSPTGTPLKGPARQNLSCAAYRDPRKRGSSTSRKASPSMLNPNTARKMAIPGKSAR